MAREQWTEVEAREALDSLRRSGMPLERFAKQRGYSPQRLYRWKSKFAQAGKCAGPKFLPVHVKRDAARGEPVTVLLRTGHVLKVAHDFDEHAFARVVALLEGT